MKVIVEPRVKAYAKLFGIEIRQGYVPSAAGIMGFDHLPDINVHAAYFNRTGVVWITSHIDGKEWCHADMQFVVLHEIGHALMDFFPQLKITKRDHEVKANGIALALCAQLGIKVRPELLRRIGKYAKISLQKRKKRR